MSRATPDPPAPTVWPAARQALAALAVLAAALVGGGAVLAGGGSADAWLRLAAVAHLAAAVWAALDSRVLGAQVATGVTLCWLTLVGADGTVVAVVPLVAGVVVTAELLAAARRVAMVVERDPRPEVRRVAVAGTVALVTAGPTVAAGLLPGVGGVVATAVAVAGLGLLALTVGTVPRPR